MREGRDAQKENESSPYPTTSIYLMAAMTMKYHTWSFQNIHLKFHPKIVNIMFLATENPCSFILVSCVNAAQIGSTSEV